MTWILDKDGLRASRRSLIWVLEEDLRDLCRLGELAIRPDEPVNSDEKCEHRGLKTARMEAE